MPFSRKLSVLLLAAAVLVITFSCDQDRAGSLYRAERDLWQAMRVEQLVSIGPETPPTAEETERVIEAYQALLADYPLTEGATREDSLLRKGIGAIRANAHLGLVRMHRIRGESKEARETLEESYGAYPWDHEVTLRLHQELIKEMEAQGDYESAALTLQKMVLAIPPRTPEGTPVVAVIDAPVRAADLLMEVGKRDMAEVELDKAAIYYNSVIDEKPDDEASTLALANLGTVAIRRGQYDRAAELLDQAERTAGSETLRPRILLVLGILHQDGQRDLEAAQAVYERLARDYPDDPAAVTAMSRRAACLTGLGRVDEAIEVLDSIEETYPHNREAGANAHLMAARILAQADRRQESLARYRVLQAGYGTSSEGMAAWFEIAGHYRAVGEPEAERSVLNRALDEFDRICRERPGTRESRIAHAAAARTLGMLDRWGEASDRLLEMASSYPGGRFNATAMIEAAAIIADRLGDPEGAAQVLEKLAEAHPDTALTAEALRQARKLRGE